MRKQCKYIICLLTAVLSILCAAPPVFALGDVEMRTVRVGYYHTAGYHEMDEAGRRSGYGYEILQAMKLYTNWTYEYIGYDKGWADMQRMLRDGEIDLVVSAVKTPARAEIYDFSNRSIGQSGACLIVKAGGSPYTAGRYDSYNGMRIGFIENATHIASTENFAKEKGFTYKPVYYKTSTELEDAVLSGVDVDAIVTSNMRIIAGTRRLEMYAMQDIYVMVQKGNAELLSEINFALEQISLYNPGLYESLHNKYYSIDPGDAVFFSPEESKFISECQADGTVLRVALTPNMSPYSYYVGDEPAGILYDISSEILRRTGLKSRLIVTKNDAEYVSLIENRGVDLRLAARFDYNHAEKLGYTLIDPYYTTSVSRIMRKERNGSINSVAVVRDSTIERDYLPMVVKDETVVRFDSVEECVEAVSSGACDATYIYTRMAQEIVFSDETNRLTSMVMPSLSIGFTIGVRDNADARLASVLEKASSSLGEDDISNFVLKYTDYMTKPMSLFGLLYNNPLIFVAMAALLLTLAFSGIMLVFTSRKRRFELEKNLQLQDALDSAERANAAKSEFMSRMSHEIRTPLNAVVGYNSIASSHLAGAKNTQEYRDAAIKAMDCLLKSDIASRHLLTVINDVLDMSAIESGKIKMAKAPFDFKKMVSSLSIMFSSQTGGQKIKFELLYDPQIDEWLVGDQMRVNQIFTNLLSNAVKFTPEGGSVTLSVSQPEADEKMAHIHFEIADTGIGMSKEFLSNIWTPFEQEDESISRRFGGTGLGLSITKNLVDLMGGVITVESEQNVGTTFKVDLALERMKQPAKTGEAEDNDLYTTYDFTGARVLLVEDNRMNMEIAKAVLSSWNIKVDEAWNGAEAVDMFRSAPAGTYRAILMDIHMPEMDGYKATRIIRESSHPEAGAVPIIAMTADVFAEDVSKAMAAGMSDHIGKPIERKVLLDTLRKYC